MNRRDIQNDIRITRLEVWQAHVDLAREIKSREYMLDFDKRLDHLASRVTAIERLREREDKLRVIEASQCWTCAHRVSSLGGQHACGLILSDSWVELVLPSDPCLVPACNPHGFCGKFEAGDGQTPTTDDKTPPRSP